MFNFLMFVGFSIIILGLYLDKTKHLQQSTFSFNQSQDINEIMQRIINIESVLYDNGKNNSVIIGRDYEDDFSFEDVMEDLNLEPTVEVTKTEEKDPFDIISLYESGKYSLDEACKILDMQKGEVLLLRNLYKKYQK